MISQALQANTAHKPAADDCEVCYSVGGAAGHERRGRCGGGGGGRGVRAGGGRVRAVAAPAPAAAPCQAAARLRRTRSPRRQAARPRRR